MQLIPYLLFNGDCEAAFKFYETSLGGKIMSAFLYEGTPAENQVPPEWRKKILHSSLKVGDEVLMGSDAPPGRYQGPPRGFSVSVSVKDPAEAERIFHALSDKGTVQMPMQKTFFAARFGMCVDAFGIPWMVDCPPAG